MVSHTLRAPRGLGLEGFRFWGTNVSGSLQLSPHHITAEIQVAITEQASYTKPAAAAVAAASASNCESNEKSCRGLQQPCRSHSMVVIEQHRSRAQIVAIFTTVVSGISILSTTAVVA